MNHTYLLGLDISTTGAKALLLDGAGAVVGSATTPLSLSTPQPLWSEQDPEAWWAGMVHSIRMLLAETGTAGDQIAAIGLTGQMHGLVLLDEAGAVLRPGVYEAWVNLQGSIRRNMRLRRYELVTIVAAARLGCTY